MYKPTDDEMIKLILDHKDDDVKFTYFIMKYATRIKVILLSIRQRHNIKDRMIAIKYLLNDCDVPDFYIKQFYFALELEKFFRERNDYINL